MAEISIKNILIGCCAAIFLVVIILFGATGGRTLLAIIAMCLPFYLILMNFNLEPEEKFFSSIFLGLSLFPLVTWVINRVIPSLTFSAIVTFLILSLIGGILWNNRKKTNHSTAT